MQAAAQIGKVSNIVIPSVVTIAAATGVALEILTKKDLKENDFPKEAYKDIDKINDCYTEYQHCWENIEKMTFINKNDQQEAQEECDAQLKTCTQAIQDGWD